MNDPILNVAAFITNSTMDGPGIRDTIWLQGCSIRCPGCINHRYWPQEPRALIPVARFQSHFRARVGLIHGCSLSGGEPTEQSESALCLFRVVKVLGLSTVLYTGRRYEELHKDTRFEELLSLTDLLIDGPFIKSEIDPTLSWRGSRNQRLIRLSNRFQDEELRGDAQMGEVVLSKNRICLHGVGVFDLSSTATI